MSTELVLDFLGIRMGSRKAEGMPFTMNLITPDNGEKFVVELENATLTNLPRFLATMADLTLTINRADLEQTMIGAKTLEAQIKDGTQRLRGTSRFWPSSQARWWISIRVSRSFPAREGGRNCFTPSPSRRCLERRSPSDPRLSRKALRTGFFNVIGIIGR